MRKHAISSATHCPCVCFWSWHCSLTQGTANKNGASTRGGRLEGDTKLQMSSIMAACRHCIRRACESTITTIEALLRFTVFSFSGQTHFQWECLGHFYTSIKISILKTLRSLDTTCITRVSTHEHQHLDHCLCTQSFPLDAIVKCPMHSHWKWVWPKNWYWKCLFHHRYACPHRFNSY